LPLVVFRFGFVPKGDGASRLEAAVFGFLRLPTAGLLFFVSAWFLMLFAGAVATDVGIRPFGYVTSMVCTIAIWLAIVPAVTAVAGRRWKLTGIKIHR
jgi:hypothetical protein